MSDRSDFPVLPKWPALVVLGAPVTPTQAAEILIRTDGFLFSSNDDEFVRELFAELGVETTGERWPDPADWDSWYAARDRYGVLTNLDYLRNSRVVSSSVNGPHGWLDWDGRVHTTSYNVGKWPTVEAVLAEWELIARTWPFLDLKSQLMSGEVCEDDVRPLVEFRVRDGRVTVDVEPKTMQAPPTFLDTGALLRRLTSSRGERGERGCTVEQFRGALVVTQRALAETSKNEDENKELT